MAEIATTAALKALCIARELLEVRIRGQILSELKESDVTGQFFREFFLQDFDLIEDKLEGLSRVDLLSSLEFFKDGVNLLFEFLERNSTNSSQNKGTLPVSKVAKSLAAFGFSSTDTKAVLKDDQSEVNRTSDEPFLTEARYKFKKSSEHAVKAISNEALKPIDRIFAARIRIIATILEHIDNTPMALVLCKSYLKKVNSMPEVLNNLKVQIGQNALRKRLNTADRKDFIWSVVSVNRVVWNYTHMCGVDKSFYADWPLINLGADDKLHPVLDSRVRGFYSWLLGNKPDASDNQAAIPSNKQDPSLLSISPQGISVAGNGQFLVADTNHECIKIFAANGNYEFSCEAPPKHEEPVYFRPRCVAASKDLFIYGGSSRGRREDKPFPAEVFVFDFNGVFISSFGKDVLSEDAVLTSMAIDDGNHLLITDDYSNCIHVFSLDGKYQSKIGEWKSHDDYSHIAVRDDTILVTHWDHIIIYDHDGKVISKRMTKDYGIPLGGIAYDSQREILYVLSKARKDLDKYKKPNVQMYDKVWNLKGIINLPKSYRSSKSMAVTPSGFIGIANVDENEVMVV